MWYIGAAQCSGALIGSLLSHQATQRMETYDTIPTAPEEVAAPTESEEAAPAALPESEENSALVEHTPQDMTAVATDLMVNAFWRRLNMIAKILSTDNDHECPTHEEFETVLQFMIKMRNDEQLDFLPMSLYLGYWVAIGLRGKRLLDVLHQATEEHGEGAVHHMLHDKYGISDSEQLSLDVTTEQERTLLRNTNLLWFFTRAKCLAYCFGEGIGNTLIHTILAFEYGNELTYELSNRCDEHEMRTSMANTKLEEFQAWASFESREYEDHSIELIVVRHIKFMGTIEGHQNSERISRTNKRIAAALVAITSSQISLPTVAMTSMPMSPAGPQPEINDPTFRIAATMIDVFKSMRISSMLLTGDYWPPMEEADFMQSFQRDEKNMQRAYLITMLTYMNPLVWSKFFACVKINPLFERLFHLFCLTRTMLADWCALEECPGFVAHAKAQIDTLDWQKIEVGQSSDFDVERMKTMSDGERFLSIGCHVTQIVMLLPPSVFAKLMTENNILESYQSWIRYIGRFGEIVRRFLEVIYEGETEALKVRVLHEIEKIEQDRTVNEVVESESVDQVAPDEQPGPEPDAAAPQPEADTPNVDHNNDVVVSSTFVDDDYDSKPGKRGAYSG